MKSKKIISAALAAAMAFSGIAAMPSFAAESYSTAYVSAYTATKNDSSTTYRMSEIVASSGYKTAYTSRYAYKKLTSSEKKFYKQIVDYFMDLDMAGLARPKGLTDDQVEKVYTLVFHEEPELFWMDSSISIYGDALIPHYKVNDYDEISKMQKQLNKNVKTLITKAKKQKTTYAKLKIFYDYLVLNNDFSLDEKGFNSTIYNAFVKSETLQCCGYAKAMQYLCDLAGISSTVVTGYNSEGNSHAWNKVYCGDGYYNLDTTWGDPIGTNNADYIQYEFFLVPDSWIVDSTHFNVNKVTLKSGKKVSLYTAPSCKKTKYNYFIKSNLNFDSASAAEAALKTQIQNAVKNKKTVVEVRVTSKNLYTQLTGNTYAQVFSKYAKNQSSNVKSISKHTTYTQASFIVHYDITYKK